MSDGGTVSTKTLYLDARRLAWFAASALFLLMVAALFVLRGDSVPILTAGIPALSALVGAYTTVDRFVSGRSAGTTDGS